MSAFVVDDMHIRYLVQAGSVYGVNYYQPDETANASGYQQIPTRLNETTICRKLLTQNYRSVEYRYQEPAEEVPAIRYQPVMLPMTPVQVIKACDCYDYQACETPDYDQTPEHRYINHLRKAAIRALPGYEDAAYEIKR